MKLAVATEISTLILWWRAFLLVSPTVFPASIVPWRWIAPVRVKIASSRVVLPLWNGPTSAMHLGPLGLVPFCPITASLRLERLCFHLSPCSERQYRFRRQGGLASLSCVAPITRCFSRAPGLLFLLTLLHGRRSETSFFEIILLPGIRTKICPARRVAEQGNRAKPNARAIIRDDGGAWSAPASTPSRRCRRQGSSRSRRPRSRAANQTNCPSRRPARCRSHRRRQTGLRRDQHRCRRARRSPRAGSGQKPAMATAIARLRRDQRQIGGSSQG